MPIYEYRCTDCDRSFEAFVRPHDSGAECPNCHSTKLTRELSTFAARSNGDSTAAAAAAMSASGTSNGGSFPSGGGCCGGGCGCH
jgi:putative FmdB family regulatory protein